MKIEHSAVQRQSACEMPQTAQRSTRKPVAISTQSHSVPLLPGASAPVRGFLEQQPRSLPRLEQYWHHDAMLVDFVAPNETHPAAARRHLAKAVPGVYLSVGTERGLMSAAMARSTHLVMVDCDPAIYRYNLMNVALLKMAYDRKDYLNLRFNTEGTTETRMRRWLDRAHAFGLDEQTRSLLGDRESSWFWSHQMDPVSHMSLFNRLRPRRPEQPAYAGTNYLFWDHAFGPVHRLAQAGRIEVVFSNLEDSEAMQTLAKNIHQRDLRLSVVDTSNAMSNRQFVADPEKVLHSLSTAVTPATIGLGTSRSLSAVGGWAYYSYPVKAVLDGQMTFRHGEDTRVATEPKPAVEPTPILL